MELEAVEEKKTKGKASEMEVNGAEEVEVKEARGSRLPTDEADLSAEGAADSEGGRAGPRDGKCPKIRKEEGEVVFRRRVL